MTSSRQWQLVRRPVGEPTDDDVALVPVDVPDPGPGEVLVRNAVMSVEPYMRGRMSEARSYVEPYALGEPMSGHAVGEVIASADPVLPEGSWVRHELGWREVALVKAAEAEPVDVRGFDPALHLGVLGQTGLTAYAGLLRIASLKPGETVFVSAAAGAVGATAVQIAKAKGCTVIGSAGSAEKVAFLTRELGADAAFDYHDGAVRDLLAAALERAGAAGIDVYFDNVGGEQLECAIRCMREEGRIALCGAISTYNATEPVPGPRNLLLMIWRRLRMEGFLVTRHLDLRPDFERDMAGWLCSGAIRSVETTVRGGITQAWPAFLDMLGGGNVGKTVVSLTDRTEG
ncbi:NADP-dependent oxidoreductase [Prauserella flavalba]|uniref:NADP-dependent oxidoreductase n=1 Tax=Prauserella flavalba TaxID=1477506 RepID=UPI000D7628E0|nr:NADP-dependent oxidoreductase [Prauserella flavalba]